MQRFPATQKQSASNRTPREINRNLVFNLIRRRQPISRADLARISGLQRSTVSLIVEELIVDRWVLEGSTGKLPRGRHPTFLHLNLQRSVLAIDIHPSQTTIGVADIGGNVLAQSVVSIPDDPTKAINAIITAARKTIVAHPQCTFEGIGISLPGRTDPDARKLVFAPNLHWPVLTIKPRIQRATSLRVEMDNVANACALSEVWFGEGDSQHDRVIVNVSEGIGTGIFANGELVRGEKGMAGEFGHVQLDPSGPPCACGSNGCWETLASNTAALRYYEKFGGKKKAIDFRALIALWQSGDRSATRALEEVATNLGRGIRMIASALAPQEIVIVGDIVSAWDLCGPIAQAELSRNSLSRSTVLRPSSEGAQARLRSAVALVLSAGFI
jgi:predicted NBD/HSP70 family sugar kinase